MAGFDDPFLLVFLVVLPVLYVVYRQVMNRRKKEAMKFSHLGFIKTGLGDKKKNRRGEI